MEYEPITVNRPQSEAWRQCQMGHREQMIRELVMNAVEACKDKPEGERDVRLYSVSNHAYPAPKLAIWNRGGMKLAAMKQFSDINAEIDKRNSVDENFGRGAKVASIMSNQLGMRFRSCYAGKVLEVTLAARPDLEKIVKVCPEEGLGGALYIRDVTAEYRGDHAFLNLKSDWTEVALMGNAPDQDTSRVPYLDGGLPQTLWLFNALGFRFFALPDGVRIHLHSGVTRHHATQRNFIPFYTMRESSRFAAQFTSVPFEGGTIHYIRARGKEDASPAERVPQFGKEYVSKVGRSSGFGGLVWRDEIHELHVATGQSKVTLTAKPWPPLATRWGLARAHNQVSILVELDHDQARNDINRIALVGPNGRIDPDHFSEVVRANIPEWVRDLEKSMQPKDADALRNIRQYLRDLIREFMDREMGLRLGGDEVGAKRIEEGQGADEHGGGKASNGERLEEADGPANAKRRLNYLEAPLDEWVGNQWFEDNNHHGLAVHYDRPTRGPGRLFFNEEHEIFTTLIRKIVERLPESETALAYSVATQAAKKATYLSVGTYVVAGLSLLQFGVTRDKAIDALSEIVLTTAMATTRFCKHFPRQVEDAQKQLRAELLEIERFVEATSEAVA